MSSATSGEAIYAVSTGLYSPEFDKFPYPRVSDVLPPKWGAALEVIADAPEGLLGAVEWSVGVP
jgi:hypothetical protein